MEEVLNSDLVEVESDDVDHDAVLQLSADTDDMSEPGDGVSPLASDTAVLPDTEAHNVVPLSTEDDGLHVQDAEPSQLIRVLPLETGSTGNNAETSIITVSGLSDHSDQNISEPISISTPDSQVVGLLLQSSQDSQAIATNQTVPVNVALPEGTIVTMANGHAVQAITLADGSTAFIQHPKANEKFMEGQTLMLEDGTTAVVQEVGPKLSSGDASSQKLPVGQAIQLEDGTTAFIQQTPKGAMDQGLQAIALEDGTTAFIATPNSENLYGEATSLENVEPITSQDALQASPNVYRLIQDKAVSIEGKAYKCNYEGCGRLYTTFHHLKVHERFHTGDRPFKCEFEGCGKAFATGYGLKSHTRVHTGEKPYKCSEQSCDKAFKTSGDLQKHVRTHTGEKPFKCPFEGCNRSFTTSNIRKVHIRTHTGERPYVCQADGCNRAFASATNYKNHIRIHTGEKPYMCTVQGCGKRFTEYSSLYKHHVVHTHCKPYSCEHCGKTYRQTSTLAMHKRTTHGEEEHAHIASESLDEESLKRLKRSPKIEVIEPIEENENMQTEESEGSLVINTSEDQQLAPVVATVDGSVTGDCGIGMVTLSATTVQQLQDAHGLASVTFGELQGRQVLVITDPSQFEALQQLANQQQQQRFSLDPGIEEAAT